MVLHYHVHYENGKVEVIFPERTSLDGLKNWVHNKFGISPSDQVILGEEVDENGFLVEANHNTILVVPRTRFKDNIGLVCGLIFLKEYPFIDNKLVQLKHVLSSKCYKPILLYLHNGQQNTFFTNVLNLEFKALENCELLCWYITVDSFKSHLKETLNSTIKNMKSLIDQVITNEQSCLFILQPYPFEDPFFSCIKGRQLDDIKNIKFQISLAAENIKSQFFNKEANKYQFCMMLKLGNRDYTCYEENEHNYLKYHIAYAFFGPPKSIQGEDVENFNFQPNLDIYEKKQIKFVQEVYKKIVKHSNLYSKHINKVVMRIIYNVVEPFPVNNSNNMEIGAFPIFVIRKCKKHDANKHACNTFIDHQLRVYDSFQKYIKEVKLSKCVMVLPDDGMYQTLGNLVALTRYYSPSCKMASQVLVATDIGTSVVGIGSGLITLAAVVPAITVAPAVLAVGVTAGIGVGLYSLGRGIMNIVDRVEHDECMSITNKEARNAYLNITVGVLGFASMGAVRGVAEMSSRGMNISRSIKYAVNGINVTSLVTSFAALGSNAYDIIAQINETGKAPSPLEILQFSTSLLFFGNSVYSFKLASTIINEAHANTINDIASNLSNKQRRMFHKSLKETIRVAGNEMKGRAEVISTIKSAKNPAELMAFLSKNNKLFNKNGVRFSLENGAIKLNGVQIDMHEFNTLTLNGQTAMLGDLPSIPSGTLPEGSEHISINVQKFSTLILNGVQLVSNVTCIEEFIRKLCSFMTKVAVNKFTDITYQVLKDTDFSFYKSLRRQDSNLDVVELVVKMVFDYFKAKSAEYMEEYEKKKKEAEASGVDEETFDKSYWIHPRNVDVAIKAMELAIMVFDIKNPVQMRPLISKCYTHVFTKLFEMAEREIRKENRRPSFKQKRACSTCSGHYYESAP